MVGTKATQTATTRSDGPWGFRGIRGIMVAATIPDPDPPVLYVSSDLHGTDGEGSTARDIMMDSTPYRRLDAPYFAWLRYKMTRARAAWQGGKVNPAVYGELRRRFNRIVDWVASHLSAGEVQMWVDGLDPVRYSHPGQVRQEEGTRGRADYEDKPADHTYPEGEELKFTQPVTQTALSQVDALFDEAAALGWSYAALYQNRGLFIFPHGQDYGVVCFLNGKRRIGKITSRYIELLSPPPGDKILRLYNPDAEPVWKRGPNETRGTQQNPIKSNKSKKVEIF